MATKTYDPGQILASLAGIPITGFADGTFVAVERDEQAFTKYVGAGGEVARARVRNTSGKVTFTLMATSPVNDLLDALAAADESSGSGSGVLFIKDGSGTTLVQATDAWVQKRPNVEFGKEVGTREWVIDCGNLNIHVGGAN